MIRFVGWLVVISAAWIALAACGNGGDGVDVSPIASVPTRTLIPPTSTPTLLPAITAPTPTDLPAPSALVSASTSGDAGSLIPDSAQSLIETIARDLSTSEAIEPGDLRLLSLEQFIWRDAAWGCAARQAESQPNVEPTPGYRIIFTTGSRVYIYHTDRGETFFGCADRDWLALQGQALPLDPIAESMVDMAARDAAKRFDETEIDLVSLLVTTWSDSSVGCPKPGAEYDDQETAGYRIVFHAGGSTAEESLIYHTSLQHVVRCEPDEEILPGFLRRAQPDPAPTPEATPET